jgi:hypothetical protein
MPKDFIIKFLVKGSFESIVNNSFDGVERRYLPDNKNMLLKTALLFNKKIKCDLFLETKYPFGFREKRIEIILRNGNQLFIVKIVRNLSSLDKEALVLDNIISDIKKYNYKLKVVGLLFTEGPAKKEVIDDIRVILQNDFMFLNKNQIDQLEEKIGLEELECHF